MRLILKHGWLALTTMLLVMVPKEGRSQFYPSNQPTGKGVASFEIWANQRSNALSSGFISTFQQGGLLSRDFFQDMLDAHPVVGGAGVQAGWSKRGSTRPIVGQSWALTGSIGSEVLVSALWRRELLELAFIGNAGHTGRIDILSGTGMRLGAFNRMSLGMEHAQTRQRIELSLVQRVAGVEWGIPNGTFWVSEEADSMEVNMQAYGLASLDAFPDTSGFQASHIMPAYGVGISGCLPLTSELFPLQLLIDFQDVGVMWEREGGLIVAIDTGFVTTGLAIPLSNIFSQGEDQDEGLTWQDIADGTSGIEPDSLYFLSDHAQGRMLMLPTRINANLTWWPSPDVQLRARARAGSWMPQTEFTLGVGWIQGERVAFGLDYRSGGWGGPRPVTWLDLRVSKKRMLSVEIDDPLGWMWGKDVSANTYGRGVRLSLRRLPGSGWVRHMGLPSKAKGPILIEDDSVFGRPKVTP